MYSAQLFCILFATPLWAHFPTDMDYFQDLVDMFNSMDTLFDGEYEIGNETLSVTFKDGVTLAKDQILVKPVNRTMKLINLGFNVARTSFNKNDTAIAEITGCLVKVNFTVSYPTTDVMDIIPSGVVYEECTSTEHSDLLVPLSEGLTKKAMMSLNRHYDNAVEIRSRILQHRLDKFLYWA